MEHSRYQMGCDAGFASTTTVERELQESWTRFWPPTRVSMQESIRVDECLHARPGVTEPLSCQSCGEAVAAVLILACFHDHPHRREVLQNAA